MSSWPLAFIMERGFWQNHNSYGSCMTYLQLHFFIIKQLFCYLKTFWLLILSKFSRAFPPSFYFTSSVPFIHSFSSNKKELMILLDFVYNHRTSYSTVFNGSLPPYYSLESNKYSCYKCEGLWWRKVSFISNLPIPKLKLHMPSFHSIFPYLFIRLLIKFRYNFSKTSHAVIIK